MAIAAEKRAADATPITTIHEEPYTAFGSTWLMFYVDIYQNWSALFIVCPSIFFLYTSFTHISFLPYRRTRRRWIQDAQFYH
jgi:hypothetical protein